MEPVEIYIERACHFKAKPKHPETGRRQLGCARCGEAKGWPGHLGAPPAFRALGSGNPLLYQAIKKAWEALLTKHLLDAGLPKDLNGLLVEGQAIFPDRARRDQGNFRVLIEKALGDALTTGGWLEDDDWSRYEFGQLAYRYEKGVSATRLMLFPR